MNLAQKKLIMNATTKMLVSSISTYAKILIHRESPGESLLFFWKKIHGHWIDKRIPLKHERFREVVKEFIEEPTLNSCC